MEQILDTMRKYKFLCSITDQVGNNFIEPFQMNDSSNYHFQDDTLVEIIEYDFIIKN